jgi:anaerobic selenocysteine-containing dehydrogenase
VDEKITRREFIKATGGAVAMTAIGAEVWLTSQTPMILNLRI